MAGGETQTYDFDKLSQPKGDKKDFNELVNTALADKKLNAQERGEILSVLEQMNSAKEKIKAETVAKLETFLNGANGGSDFEKTKKVLLEKMAANKSIEAQKPAPAASVEAKKEEPAPAPEPEKKEEPKKEEPKKEEPKKEEAKPQDGLLDKTGRFFTGKLDINALPKEDQAAIKDLQDAGFRFKPVEGKTGEYSVDMNGLGDKSKIDLAKKTFTTDMLKKDGKDFTTEFKDSADAKDKMTKANSLITTMQELNPLEKVYDTHRTFQEQEQYEKLSKQKATLEQDLGIAAPAPKAAWAEWGK